MWRAPVSLVLLIGVASGAAHAATEADQQFTFAVRLLQEAQHDLAAEAFGDFLRDFGEDRRAADAHYYLAILARQAGDAKLAATHLDQVTHPLHVNDSQVAMMRGQLHLEAGDAKAALAALLKVEPDELADHKSRSTWHYLLGAAYGRQRNVEAAAKQFDKATEADSPVRDRALLELGKARIELDQRPAAIEALGEAIDAATDPAVAAEARWLIAGLAYRAKQFERAAAAYRAIAARHENSDWFAPATIGLLRSLYAGGDDKQLIQQHDKLARHVPADALGEALYLRAAAHVRLEQYDKATGWLEQFLQRTDASHPQRDSAIYLAGVCLFHTDPAAYERWYQQTRPAGRELAYLRASAAIKREQPEQAVRHLSPLIDPADQPYARRALMQRAALHEQLGDPAKAAADYALYARRYGKDDDAGTADLRRRAIELAFDAGQHDRVVELAPDWLKAAGDDKAAAPLRLRYALSLMKRNQPDAAGEQLDTLIQAKTDDRIATLARFYRGLLLAAGVRAADDDRLARAAALLADALDRKLPEPQRVEAWAVLARLHRMAGEDAKALAAYEQLRKLRPQGAFDPITALWVGRGLVESAKPQAALPWLDVVIERDDVDDAARAAAMFHKAQALVALGRHERAIDAYRRLLAFSTAYGNRGRLGLARALAPRDIEAALEEYQGLVNVRDSAVAATALYESAMIYRDLAQRLAANDNAQGAAAFGERARKRLNRIAILYNLPELDPLPLRALLALGRLDAEVGRRDLAEQRLDKVLERKDRPAWALLARAQRHVLRGQRAEARTLLNQAIEEHGNTDAAAEAKARLDELGDAR